MSQACPNCGSAPRVACHPLCPEPRAVPCDGEDRRGIRGRIACLAALAAAIPCPSWVAEQIDAHHRRRVLVLQIWMLSDKPTAFAALWLARASWLHGGSVEGSLRRFKEALLR